MEKIIVFFVWTHTNEKDEQTYWAMKVSRSAILWLLIKKTFDERYSATNSPCCLSPNQALHSFFRFKMAVVSLPFFMEFIWFQRILLLKKKSYIFCLWCIFRNFMNGVRLRCFHWDFWWIIGFVRPCIFYFFHWRETAFTHRAEMNVPEVVWNDRIFLSRPHVRKNLHMYIIAIVIILNSQSIKLIIKRQIQTGWHKHNAYNKIE